MGNSLYLNLNIPQNEEKSVADTNFLKAVTDILHAAHVFKGGAVLGLTRYNDLNWIILRFI